MYLVPTLTQVLYHHGCCLHFRTDGLVPYTQPGLAEEAHNAEEQHAHDAEEQDEEALHAQEEEPTLLEFFYDEADYNDDEGTEDDVPNNNHLYSDMDTDIDDA